MRHFPPNKYVGYFSRQGRKKCHLETYWRQTEPLKSLAINRLRKHTWFMLCASAPSIYQLKLPMNSRDRQFINVVDSHQYKARLSEQQRARVAAASDNVIRHLVAMSRASRICAYEPFFASGGCGGGRDERKNDKWGLFNESNNNAFEPILKLRESATVRKRVDI